jgi:ABC-type amino acid transport substrate-binding protein
MQPLKAHVRNGRLVLDEPTDLPEGEIVYLQPVDAVLDEEFDEEERAQLRRALDEGIEQMKAGQTIDVADAMAALRAHR